MALQTYMAGLDFLERTQKENIISESRKSSSDERDKKISISSIDGIKFLVNH